MAPVWSSQIENNQKITNCFINSAGRAPLSAWPFALSGRVIDLTQVCYTVRNKTFISTRSSPVGWVGWGISLHLFPSILRIVLHVFPPDCIAMITKIKHVQESSVVYFQCQSMKCSSETQLSWKIIKNQIVCFQFVWIIHFIMKTTLRHIYVE